ncbi:TIGR03986 family type III CRISPR-associated RAMP protein [Thioalkalivibrio halophilus]|uniref:CRISPR-associated RAMP family protein n=1 Tax=Thioalkalivibrio halophilus TaxID=252474 RepID=A0A1V3A0G2_9GAMM|nr:TIGR03986 family CRISPR-associated RAMP protein [Thioalkalivibrio halophilus]OOC10832.1 CRISPR-associated RAMP family protein [Thioalkalivibrio halophilus]
MTLNLPYNFVPLTPFVLRPDWHAHVSHDHPFQDGWSGEIRIRLTAHTPLSVGGAQTPGSDREPGKVHLARTPDGRPAVPASSLKGMLRHVLEIAAFGHFREVEDQRLGVRDLTKADNFYMKEMVKAPVQAGWLRYREGSWYIRPVNFVRLHQEELIRAFGVDEQKWKKAGTVQKRYGLIGTLPEIHFDVGPVRNNDQADAIDLGRGPRHGHVVVTGQPGPDYTRKNAKKREFIFYDAGKPRDEIPVSPEVMSDFQFIHQESPEWNDFWKPQLHSVSPGVPVFWHAEGDQSSVRSLGLAMMYRLAYRNTLHDAIRHTRAGKNAASAHLDDDAPDLAELLFGRIDAEGPNGSLRGRVMPGLAECEEDVATHWEGPMVLNGPKPTFYPAYLRQQETKKDYITLMDDRAELSGWKRYPVRSSHHVPRPPDKSGPKVQVKLETVPSDTTFSTQIRFHNLRDVELGALVWALDFGGRGDLRHSLGTGKPFGFGQVSVGVTDARLEPNDPAREIDDDALVNLEACRHAFVQYMNDAWAQATDGAEERWEDSEPLRQLLAMADPSRAADAPLDKLGNPKFFMDARKDGEYLKPHLKEKDGWHSLRTQLGDSAAPEAPGFGQALEETRRQHQQAQEKQEREQKRQAMSPEETQVDDLRQALEACEAEPGKSRWNNLNKAIRELPDEAAGWDELIPQLADLLDRAENLADGHDQKKIVKAVRQARTRLSIAGD